MVTPQSLDAEKVKNYVKMLPSGKFVIDPENHQFLEETNLPIPIYQGLC